MTEMYRNAPVRNSPPKAVKSWEERGFEQGHALGLRGAKMKDATKRVPQSPIMQGYRAGMKERRLKNLLLKKQ